MKNNIKANGLIQNIDNNEALDESTQSKIEQSYKYKENDIYEYRNSLPCYNNLMDNFTTLQYKGIKIPRLSINNDFYFEKYKIPFNEIFNKINLDYVFTKNFIFKFSKILNNKNKDENQTKSIGINNKIINNEYLYIPQIKNPVNNIDINNEKNKIINNNSLIKKTKTILKIFKLKTYGAHEMKKNLFHKKRGRKSTKKKPRHIHSAIDDDNILRKIQVHFLSFLVSFTNDYIDALSINIEKKNIIHFKHLDYKYKKIINHESIEKMKASNIGQILQIRASPKNKGCDNINQIIYSKLCDQFPDLKEKYFNIIFKDFFIDYYYNNKNDDLILINDVNVKLSVKTKNFNKLIQNNINHIRKFNNVVKYYYLNNRKEKISENTIKNIIIINEQKPLFIID